METILHINSDFKCVYLLNGSFVETAETVKYNTVEPIYITVLPLDAHLLPYTVKIFDGKALSNQTLVSVYTLPDKHVYIKIMPRYNYVYSKEHPKPAKGNGCIPHFFISVKQGDLKEARSCMTEELSGSINDADLSAFFDEYKDIIENTSRNLRDNSYFLIDQNDKGVLFKFELINNLIDNIIG